MLAVLALAAAPRIRALVSLLPSRCFFAFFSLVFFFRPPRISANFPFVNFLAFSFAKLKQRGPTVARTVSWLITLAAAALTWRHILAARALKTAQALFTTSAGNTFIYLFIYLVIYLFPTVDPWHTWCESELPSVSQPCLRRLPLGVAANVANIGGERCLVVTSSTGLRTAPVDPPVLAVPHRAARKHCFDCFPHRRRLHLRVKLAKGYSVC